MKKFLQNVVMAFTMLLLPFSLIGQANPTAPDLGNASNFVLFNSAGAFHNLGVSTIIGDVGENDPSESVTGFPPGLITGTIYNHDATTILASTDVGLAYAFLFSKTPDAVIGTTMGGGQVIHRGVYSTGAATTLNGNLTFDADGDPNAVFIIQIDGAFATGTYASVSLLNGAKASNIYWQINGAVSVGDFSVMRGNIIAGGAITFLNGSTLYGRALTTAGAINVSAMFGLLPAPPTINTTQVDVLCFGTSTGSATAIPSGGLAPYSYSWNTLPVQTLATATGLAAGPYTVTVTDSNGSVATANVTITQPLAPLLAVLTSQTNVLCFGNSTGAINVTVTGGTTLYSYEWRKNGLLPAYATTQDLTLLGAGTYDLTVTDANGCTAVLPTVIISEPASALMAVLTSQTNVLCFGSSSGAINVTVTGGTTLYSYEWRKNGLLPAYATTEDLTALGVGSYDLTVTDANGCMAILSTVMISGPASVLSYTASHVDVICLGSATGSATVLPDGGTPPYFYSWNTIPVQTTATATGLVGGTYRVTITDNSGCSLLSSDIIVLGGSVAVATITPGGSTTVCFGDRVTLTANAGISYLWSTGATTQSISAYASGNYTVTVTNIDGCIATSPVTVVTVNPVPMAIITPGGPTSFCTGNSVTLTASLGSSYLWSTGATTRSITVNMSGNYTVIVLNAFGCSAMSNATIVTVYPLPIVTITPNGPTTFCQGDSVLLTSSPGTSYLWSTGATTQSISVKNTGNYSVTVTNLIGCSATSPVTRVTVNVRPVPTISRNWECNQEVFYTETGKTNYIWRISSGGTILSGQGTYQIFVTWNLAGAQWVSVNYDNEFGCSATDDTVYDLIVTLVPNPAGMITSVGSVCAGQRGVAFSTPSIYNANSYVWTLPEGARIASGEGTNSITVDFSATAVSGNVTVAGSNIYGLGLVSAAFYITVNPIPETPEVSYICNLHLMTSSSPVGNQWYLEGVGAIPGATGQTYTSAATGWYWVTVTLNGCPSLISNKVYDLITSQCTNGVPGDPLLASFNIYPIPNDGSFTVFITSQTDDVFTIEVINMLGEKIYRRTDVQLAGGKFEEQINLRGSISKGFYFVTFSNAEQKVVKKIIVN